MSLSLNLGVDVLSATPVIKMTNVRAPIAMIAPPNSPPAAPPGPGAPPGEPPEGPDFPQVKEAASNLESSVGTTTTAGQTAGGSGTMSAGTIVGAVVGGVAGVIALVGFIYFVIVRRKGMPQTTVVNEEAAKADLERAASKKNLAIGMHQIDPNAPDPSLIPEPAPAAPPVLRRPSSLSGAMLSGATQPIASLTKTIAQLTNMQSSAVPEAETAAEPQLSQLDKLLAGLNATAVLKVKEEVTAAGLDPETVMEECKDAMDIIVKPIIHKALADFPALRELVDKRLSEASKASEAPRDSPQMRI